MDEHDWVALGDLLRRARSTFNGSPAYQWYIMLCKLTDADRKDAADWLWVISADYNREDV